MARSSLGLAAAVKRQPKRARLMKSAGDAKVTSRQEEAAGRQLAYALAA